MDSRKADPRVTSPHAGSLQIGASGTASSSGGGAYAGAQAGGFEQPLMPRHLTQQDMLNSQLIYRQPLYPNQLLPQNFWMGFQTDAFGQQQFRGLQTNQHSVRHLLPYVMPIQQENQQSAAMMLPTHVQQLQPQLPQQGVGPRTYQPHSRYYHPVLPLSMNDNIFLPSDATTQQLPPVSGHVQKQTVEESHQAVSDQSQNQIPKQNQAVLTSHGQLMPGNTSMGQPMQNQQVQQSMRYTGNNNAALAMQGQAMALEPNIDLSLPQNGQQKVNERNMGPQSKLQVTSPRLARDSCPHSDAYAHSGSTTARRAMSPGHLGSTSNTFLLNNSGAAQGQQQRSAQYKEESKSSQKSPLHIFIDPSGALHAVDTDSKAYLWTTQTKTPAYRFYKDASLKLETSFGFNSFGSPIDDDIIDENYLTHFDRRNGNMPINVSTHQSLQERVDELYTSNEYKVEESTSRFWINTDSGQVYTFPNEEDLVMVLRKDFCLFNTSKNTELRFSILKEDEDSTRMRFVHVRTFERLFEILENFGIEKESIPFEKLRVYYDRRIKREDGTIMYKGFLNDPCDHEFVSKSVMVQEDDGKDGDRIMRLYSHLGSHPNIVNFFGIQEFENQKYLIFEMFENMEEIEDLDKTLRCIILGALHIYKKERIHGKLERFNVVNSAGVVKLFGVKGYMWTTKNEKQELLNLGNLLDNCIWDMHAYEKENPVACDFIKKLRMNSMTLPRLRRHPFLWEPEATMKFFYDVTVCIDDRKRGSGGSNLELEFEKKVNQDRVYKNKKENLHKIYMEHMELNSKFWTYGTRSLSCLLKISRNTYSHEPQLDLSIRGLWGRSTNGLGKYWCGKNGVFPYLPIVVFDLVEQCCPKGGSLKQYTG